MMTLMSSSKQEDSRDLNAALKTGFAYSSKVCVPVIIQQDNDICK